MADFMVALLTLLFRHVTFFSEIFLPFFLFFWKVQEKKLPWRNRRLGFAH